MLRAGVDFAGVCLSAQNWWSEIDVTWWEYVEH